MRRRIRPIERLERLEDRTCPSVLLPGDSTTSATATMDSQLTVSESEMNPYEWLMMAMSPGDMMKIANEIDQSAGESGMAVASSGAGEMLNAMTKKKSESPAEPAMSSSTEMAPAQMVMSPEPLVRPGSSSSGRTRTPMTEMADLNASEDEANSASDEQGSMAAGATGPSGEYEPPRLSPGNLDSQLAPELDPGSIDPTLEQARPSGTAP